MGAKKFFGVLTVGSVIAGGTMYGKEIAEWVSSQISNLDTSKGSQKSLSPVVSNVSKKDACEIESEAFQECFSKNSNIDMSKCEFFAKLLNECRQKSVAY